MQRRSWSTAIVLIWLSTIGLLMTGSRCIAEGGPAAAAMPLAADGRLRLSAGDRCPVCAMFPARRPQSAAAMTLKDGATFYFCSNGCLLRSWLRPTVYLGRERAVIDRLVVLDYFSGQPIDARTATWVAGSDVVGPMGPAIVALGDAGQLAIFKDRHGGKTVFTFDRLDDALWKRINNDDLPDAAAD